MFVTSRWRLCFFFLPPPTHSGTWLMLPFIFFERYGDYFPSPFFSDPNKLSSVQHIFPRRDQFRKRTTLKLRIVLCHFYVIKALFWCKISLLQQNQVQTPKWPTSSLVFSLKWKYFFMWLEVFCEGFNSGRGKISSSIADFGLEIVWNYGVMEEELKHVLIVF